MRRHPLRGYREPGKAAHLLLQDVSTPYGSADGCLGRVSERGGDVDWPWWHAGYLSFFGIFEPRILPELWQLDRRNR